MNEVFICATNYVVVGDGNGVNAAPRGLEDVDTLERTNVPNLRNRKLQDWNGDGGAVHCLLFTLMKSYFLILFSTKSKDITCPILNTEAEIFILNTVQLRTILERQQVTFFYLDGLVRSAIQVILRRDQCSHPVIQTSELFLQLQLCAHNVPHLQTNDP